MARAVRCGGSARRGAPYPLRRMNDAELTPEEVEALEEAAGYDSGVLSEAVAALGHEAAFQSNITASAYRQLGSLCFILARRMEQDR
jgi:hypothetical protein